MNILLQYQTLVVPIVVMIISQFLKLVLESRNGGFAWKHMNSYGGMPSSHTAMFISLTLMVGMVQGWTTPLFAVTALVTAAFVRDAFGIRWSLGYHGKILNHLITTLSTDVRKKFPRHLEERLGHTPMEVLAGGVLGIVLTLLFYFLLNK